MPIVSFKLAKVLRLFLKNDGDGFGRVACFKLLCKGMFDQFGPRLVFVILKSRVIEALEEGRLRGLTHH